jgi:hypothetical protein
MPKRVSNRMQLTFRWEPDNATWERVPQAQQSLCRELLSQLLRMIAGADESQRSKSDEREDSKPSS